MIVGKAYITLCVKQYFKYFLDILMDLVPQNNLKKVRIIIIPNLLTRKPKHRGISDLFKLSGRSQDGDSR